MPINGEALFDAVKLLAEEEEVRVAWCCTLGSSVVTTSASTAGLLLLGPPGLFLGATIAGIGAYWATRNKFKPMFRILKEDLSPAQQEKLKELLCEAFREFSWQDVASVVAMLADQRELKLKIFSIVQTYLVKQVLNGAAGQPVDVEINRSNLEAYINDLSTPLAPPAVGTEMNSASQEYHMMSRFEELPLQRDNSERRVAPSPHLTRIATT